MSTLLFIVIGVVASKTLESCEIIMKQWQYWVILACIVSSMLVAYFLM